MPSPIGQKTQLRRAYFTREEVESSLMAGTKQSSYIHLEIFYLECVNSLNEQWSATTLSFTSLQTL